LLSAQDMRHEKYGLSRGFFRRKKPLDEP